MGLIQLSSPKTAATQRAAKMYTRAMVMVTSVEASVGTLIYQPAWAHPGQLVAAGPSTSRAQSRRLAAPWLAAGTRGALGVLRAARPSIYRLAASPSFQAMVLVRCLQFGTGSTLPGLLNRGRREDRKTRVQLSPPPGFVFYPPFYYFKKILQLHAQLSEGIFTSCAKLGCFDPELR